MPTKTNFGNMLKEVITAPNQSRSKKFLKLKQMGVSESEARKALDQYINFENADQPEEDIFRDTAKPRDSFQVPTRSDLKKPAVKKTKKGSKSLKLSTY